MDFFFKIYGDLPKQGPGSKESTLKALNSIPEHREIKKILDAGCGTGRHTILLAQNTFAKITALDFYDQQIKTLTNNIKKAGLLDRVEIVKGDMADLSFSNEKFDLIWSESSIYNIGFENGLRYWKDYIRDNGYLVVSEAIWLTDNPSKEIKNWWNEQYPEIQTAHQKIKIIKQCSYELITHFVQPKSDWWEGYYDLLEKRAAEYEKLKLNPEEQEVISMAKTEIDMFKRYSDQYGYAFFVMRNNF
ncbi:MAG: class I SAM-dependent methyltransferase [Pseudomonadota bacterium]